MKSLPWIFPIFFDFQLKVYYICTSMREEFTSVVLNRCVIWNRNVTNCRRWSATPKPQWLVQIHLVRIYCSGTSYGYILCENQRLSEYTLKTKLEHFKSYKIKVIAKCSESVSNWWFSALNEYTALVDDPWTHGLRLLYQYFKFDWVYTS